MCRFGELSAGAAPSHAPPAPPPSPGAAAVGDRTPANATGVDADGSTAASASHSLGDRTLSPLGGLATTGDGCTTAAAAELLPDGGGVDTTLLADTGAAAAAAVACFRPPPSPYRSSTAATSRMWIGSADTHGTSAGHFSSAWCAHGVHTAAAAPQRARTLRYAM